MLYGSKFVETGAGIGHNIDTLLVGIAVQARWALAKLKVLTKFQYSMQRICILKELVFPKSVKIDAKMC